MEFANSKLKMDRCINVGALKQRVINEYNKAFNQLRKGYKPDLALILDQLSFIELQCKIDNYVIIYQKLNNNEL